MGGVRHAALALLLVVHGAALHAGTSSHERALIAAYSDEASSKETPIQRVVKLLQEMKSQLSTEAKAESETYDKMMCWCQTSEKEKKKAVEDAEAKITELESMVGSGAARDGELATKIEHLKGELAEMKESLAKATAIREKEAAEFRSDEKETVQAIAMLKNAVLVLGKHNAGLIQMSPAVTESMGSALRWVQLKHEELLELAANDQTGSLLRGDKPQKKSASLLSLAAGTSASTGINQALLQALNKPKSAEIPIKFAARVLENAAAAQKLPSFAQQPAGAGESYAPQSSQIFGVLNTMLEDFEANLSSSQKDEVKAADEYALLKEASETQIDASAAKLDEMETDYAGTIKALSDAKEDLTATREQRGADVEFLSNLNVQCKEMDAEYQKRTKARNLEIEAVNDAVGILTEDDARTLFQKKMGSGASLLQLKAVTNMRALRSKAAAVLMQAAAKMQQEPSYAVWHADDTKPHEKLAMLAMQVQLDAFTKVKKAIDDMVVELKKQQADEVTKKAFCTEEFNVNEKERYETSQVIKDLKDQISSLEDQISKLAEEIGAAQDEIARTKIEVKKASELREQENKEFQEEVTDQRAMQHILAKAIDRMRMVYKKAALLQQSQEPPAQWSKSKQNTGASPVIGMMEQIVEDSKADEADLMSAEQQSQVAYESFVKDSDASLDALNASIEEKTKTKAKASADKESASAQKGNNEDRLESLEEYNADMHKDCDYVMKNFDIRQKARLEEIEALAQAKAVLSGAVEM
jgi:outer membrane murein-binding lipoprotein Lpp